MRFPQPHSRVRGRILAGCLLLATAAAAAAGPAAVAAPLSPAVSAKSQHAVVGSGGGSSPGQVTWSVFPATSTGPDPHRNLFNYGVVKAGSTIVDHVEIVNRSKQSAAFSLYATDATGTTLQDVLTLLPANKKPVDIGAWVSFPGGAGQLSTIIPGGKAIIESFTVTVPVLATPGDHTGGLIAAVGVPKKNAAGVMVVQNYRIAVPIELRVPGALHAGLRVQSISTGFSDPLNPFGNGSATVAYTVTNTGNVRQTGTQVVTVTGPFGQSSVVRLSHLPTILPGDSVRVPASVPGLFPDGPMTAHVVITPGWPPLTIPVAQSASLATGSASLFAMPWSIIGLVLLLVAIGVGIWQFLRWRRRLRRAELAAVAAHARRDTERRILGRRAAANGHGTGTQPSADPGSAETASSPAGATAPSGTQDSGSATAGSATE